MGMTAEQRRMYTAIGKKGETIVRHDGQIAGQQFIVDGAEDCTIHVLDHCTQVTVDDAKRCEIVIGPCEDSLFVRDCEDCEIHAVCRQLRTRDCVRCKIYLYVLTDPIIESSHTCEIGEWHIAYPGLDKHFKSANLDPQEPNLFKKIYDFTPDEHSDKVHWTLASSTPPQRTIEVPEVTVPVTNPLHAGAATATTTTAAAPAATAGSSLAAAEDVDPRSVYTLVRPKRFAIKRNPVPTLIVEVVVDAPAEQAGSRRLLIYKLEGLGAETDLEAAALTLCERMPPFSGGLSHADAVPQVQRLLSKLVAALGVAGGGSGSSSSSNATTAATATTAGVGSTGSSGGLGSSGEGASSSSPGSSFKGEEPSPSKPAAAPADKTAAPTDAPTTTAAAAAPDNVVSEVGVAKALSREAKVQAIFTKFDPSCTGRLQYSEMVALVRATEGATLDLTSFEEIASYIGADAAKGLSLQDLTNFFGLSETDDDLNENYEKLFVTNATA